MLVNISNISLVIEYCKFTIHWQGNSNNLFFQYPRMHISIYNSLFPQLLLPIRKIFDFDARHHYKLKTFRELFGSLSLDHVSACSSPEIIEGGTEWNGSLMLNILSSPTFIFSASHVHVSCWSCSSRTSTILLFFLSNYPKFKSYPHCLNGVE